MLPSVVVYLRASELYLDGEQGEMSLKITNYQKEAIENRVMENIVLVKKLALSLISRLPPNIELDDLVQAGMIGLIEAAQNFDPSSSVPFGVFASHRIRGAMIDELRNTDFLPRTSRRQAREIDSAILELENLLNRQPKESEIANFLNLTLDEYYAKLQNSKGIGLINIPDEDSETDFVETIEDKNAVNPEDMLRNKQFKQDVKDAITSMSEREVILMELHYEKDFNFREISEILSISEARVSQIHAQVLSRIRAYLMKKGWLG